MVWFKALNISLFMIHNLMCVDNRGGRINWEWNFRTRNCLPMQTAVFMFRSVSDLYSIDIHAFRINHDGDWFLLHEAHLPSTHVTTKRRKRNECELIHSWNFIQPEYRRDLRFHTTRRCRQSTRIGLIYDAKIIRCNCFLRFTSLSNSNECE